MKTSKTMIGGIGSTSPNPLGDIYIFGYYMKPSKGLKYYITVKRLGGGKRQTLLTTQIFEKIPSSENMYKSAIKAASSAGLIPQYKTGDPVKFWEKHGGNKNHIVFNQFLYMSSKFNKSHKAEGNLTSI